MDDETRVASASSSVRHPCGSARALSVGSPTIDVTSVLAFAIRDEVGVAFAAKRLGSRCNWLTVDSELPPACTSVRAAGVSVDTLLIACKLATTARRVDGRVAGAARADEEDVSGARPMSWLGGRLRVWNAEKEPGSQHALSRSRVGPERGLRTRERRLSEARRRIENGIERWRLFAPGMVCVVLTFSGPRTAFFRAWS